MGASRDRCYIYDSACRKVRQVGSSFDLGWVPWRGTPETWVVVFETGEWRNGYIKIAEPAVRDYFNRGFEFTVEGPSQIALIPNSPRVGKAHKTKQPPREQPTGN